MAEKKVSIVYEIVDKASKQAKSMGNEIADAGKKFLNSKISLLAMTAAVGIAINNFASLQTKMTNVGNLTGATRKEIENMTKAVSDLSIKTGQPVEQLAESLFDVQSAGISAGKSIEFLAVASKLAVSGATSVTSATSGLINIMNAYKLSAENAMFISDKLFEAQVGGITTVEKLSNSIGDLAPIASAAGISIDDMLISVQNATKKGIETSTVMRALRQTVGALLKPSKEAKQAFEDLGIPIDSTTLKTKGLTGFLVELGKKTNYSVAEMTKLLPSTESLSTVMAIATGTAEELSESMDKMALSAGATERAFKTQSETIAFQISILQSTFRAFSDQTVAYWAPILTKMLQFITVTDEMTNASNEAAKQEFKNTLTYKKGIFDKLKLLKKATEDSKKEWLKQAISGDEVEEERAYSAYKTLKTSYENQQQIVNDYGEWSRNKTKEDATKEKAIADQELADQIAADELALQQLVLQAEAEYEVERVKNEEIKKLAKKKKKDEEKAESDRLKMLAERLKAETANAKSIDEVGRGLANSLFNQVKQSIIAQLFATQYADIAKIGSNIAVHLAKGFAGIPEAAMAIGQLAVPVATISAGVGAINSITPQFANGGLVQPTSSGTTVTMGEAGQTELGLPSGKVQAFLDEAGVGSSVPIEVSIMLDKKVLVKALTNGQRAGNRNKTL